MWWCLTRSSRTPCVWLGTTLRSPASTRPCSALTGRSLHGTGVSCPQSVQCRRWLLWAPCGLGRSYSTEPGLTNILAIGCTMFCLLALLIAFLLGYLLTCLLLSYFSQFYLLHGWLKLSLAQLSPSLWNNNWRTLFWEFSLCNICCGPSYSITSFW